MEGVSILHSRQDPRGQTKGVQALLADTLTYMVISQMKEQHLKQLKTYLTS